MGNGALPFPYSPLVPQIMSLEAVVRLPTQRLRKAQIIYSLEAAAFPNLTGQMDFVFLIPQILVLI